MHRFTAVVFPEACEGCTEVLPRTPSSDPRRYQCLEILESGHVLTEYQRHEVECPRCSHRTLSAYDSEVIPASRFGPRLTGIIVMLTGTYHLSRARTQLLLYELYGIKVSTGTISAMEHRTSEALVPAVAEALHEVQQAPVKYTDATSWLMAGITLSLWTIATEMTTFYCILKDGRRDTTRPMFGASLVGIKVSDRASVFDFWDMARRQICWAHLVRQFVSFAEKDGPAGVHGQNLLDCTALLFEYWHGFKDGKLTREKLIAMMCPQIGRAHV